MTLNIPLKKNEWLKKGSNKEANKMKTAMQNAKDRQTVENIWVCIFK